MRAGLSTIQQTLTPEAASVLNHSIAEAGRRNHGQTTPLHVAATLLASPSGFLRQACIKSHPNSSHPLQCRALELCFSVALERLPTAQNMSPGGGAMEPPISNALMAALKRAQAHQRRGCPEQQQQPLLAVKVELEQLIISILDDPSVSRVMREASFSSPAVKSTIEQSLNSSSPAVNSTPIGLGFRPTTAAATTGSVSRNLYLNPRLQQGSSVQLGNQRGEEVKRIIDILLRAKKRNPVLVGDSEPEAVIRELLRRIEGKELTEAPFYNAHVIYLEKEIPSDRAQIPARIKELGNLIETQLGNSGVFVNLGNLRWLVEQSVDFGVSGLSNNMQQQALTEAGRASVSEMARLVSKFGEASSSSSSGRLWLLGTATCETYLRCQVYHPTMETDWDLQAVPITTRAPLPGIFPRLGTNGILGSSLDSLSPLKGFPSPTITQPRRASENVDPARRNACCPQCTQNCEKEVADMLKEIEKSDSEVKSEPARPPLPQWLQNAKTTNDQSPSNSQEVVVKKKTQEVQKKWHEACLHLHPKFHQQQSVTSERIVPTPFSMTSLYNNPNLLGRQFQSKLPLNKNLGSSLQLSSNLTPIQPSDRVVASPPKSPVQTDLALGQTKATDDNPEQNPKEHIKDFLGCMSSESKDKFNELQSKKLLDADSFKKLLKGLTEKVCWQHDAASAVATTVTQCKVGNGKRRGGAVKGDTWLLFLGPDRVGKKKMAGALSELVSGCNPIIFSLKSRIGDDGELSDVHVRGKTALDRIAEAIRRNPFSVIMLEDIDEADILLRGSIKRAMERGRFSDSYGREISLGNVLFILTANWLPDNLKYLSNGTSLDEEKLANLAKGNWQLRLSVSKRTPKRRPSWFSDEDRSTKPRKEMGSGLSFDLNEAADAEEDRADGSLNSSDLTVDHEDNQVLHHNLRSPTITHDLLDVVDDAIVFKPVDFGVLRRSFSATIAKRFSTVMGSGISIEVQEEALGKITSGVWLGQTSIDEWIEKVLVPSFHQLKLSFNPGTNGEESLVVRLEDDGDSDGRSISEHRLPASVRVVAAEGN